MGILRFLDKPLLKTRPWVFDKYKAHVFAVLTQKIHSKVVGN